MESVPLGNTQIYILKHLDACLLLIREASFFIDLKFCDKTSIYQIKTSRIFSPVIDKIKKPSYIHRKFTIYDYGTYKSKTF